MVITASWLTGSIIGLWLENLDRNIGVGLGLFCYYSVYALVSNICRSQVLLSLLQRWGRG